jgi:hypothetical protein
VVEELTFNILNIMTEFSTIDIYGNPQTFQYVMDFNKLDNEVSFRVFSIPANEMRWFSYRLKLLSKAIAKSEHISNNNCPEFSKMGIPERIIEIASQELNMDILSSPINPQSGNFLIPASKKAWERLILKNKNAHFDADQGCFYFTKCEKI